MENVNNLPEVIRQASGRAVVLAGFKVRVLIISLPFTEGLLHMPDPSPDMPMFPTTLATSKM